MNKMLHKQGVDEAVERQREINNQRRLRNKSLIETHKQHIMLTNITSRDNLKELIKKGMQEKFKNAYVDQQLKNHGAGRHYTVRKEAQKKMRFDREVYNVSVAKAHQARAVEISKQRELNELRIKQLEEIEQRLVGNLQSTLLTKNAAINELNQKSRSLKKVMQPRMAYKYKNLKSEKTSLMKDNFMNLTQMNSSRDFIGTGTGPQGYFGEAQRSQSIKPRSGKQLETGSITPIEESQTMLVQ